MVRNDAVGGHTGPSRHGLALHRGLRYLDVLFWYSFVSTLAMTEG